MEDFRLKVFHSVARNKSFTKAAAELLITQPAVTKQIKNLEELLEVRQVRAAGVVAELLRLEHRGRVARVAAQAVHLLQGRERLAPFARIRIRKAGRVDVTRRPAPQTPASSCLAWMEDIP